MSNSTYRFCGCIYNGRASNAPFTPTADKYRAGRSNYCAKYSLLRQFSNPKSSNTKIGYNHSVQKCDNIDAYCSGSVDDCMSLNRLKRIMLNYVSFYFDIECVDIQLILNDFLHLLDQHNILEEFEYIADCFGYCDIRNCDIVNRHYRQRRGLNMYKEMSELLKYEENMDDDGNTMARIQILDTIHCYFNHTFDIGFRMRCKDKTLLSGECEESVTMKYHEINKITSKGKKLYHETIGNNNGDSMEANKFITPFNSNDAQKNVDLKGTINRNEPNEPLMYSYGVVFEYDNNHQYTSNKGKHNYIRYVPQKYDTFKEEIINLTKIADIGHNQWLHQHKKAELHYNSYYCKAFVAKYNKAYNEVLDGPIKRELKIEHLLALMFYCNYDKLQYEFSKTYRPKIRDESNLLIAARHSNFYHLGKYIKEAVHYFGTRINSKDSNNVFYHGVSQQTVFSSASSAQFNGPLSTSTDYSVAACFANQNGLIVELTDTNSIYPSSKYFAMHWLSCYSNEQECLFIACEGPLLFKDIVSVSSGTEYRSIIKALHLFDHVFKGSILDHKVRENDIEIAYKCLSHQLNVSGLDIQYDAFETLQEYAAKLINQYFVKQTELWLDLNALKTNSKIEWIYKILCLTDRDWINLDIMNILFPNLECIYLRWRIQLNMYIMDNILKYLQNLQNIHKHNRFKRLRIAVDEINSSMNIQSAMDEFKDKLQMIGFTIYIRANTDLCIEKSSVVNILLCD